MQSALKTTVLTLLLIAGIGSAIDAMAQAVKDTRLRYKWRDEAGSLHFADNMPPEAARLGYELVNQQGVVVRRVERAKTTEELAKDKADAEKLAEEQRKADENSRLDAQMLAAYPTEEDLRRSIQAQLDLITQNIQATEVGIASQEKSLAERLVHAGEQERNGKVVPTNVQNQINTLRKGLNDQKAFLERRMADRATMEKQLVVDLERYRTLKAKQDEQRKGR
ncbi:uncharacterized protein DUF4124 [Tahibacter aquaticus]|uniref:Uncharacterized protein DUF4124 n=1 Tax=Tahibacter aquaticus TaxID=520092 RepID=A0A4R6YGQ6_9GAMM|nr:DUF4124 domain-containing protein [Tahibacter aquaticus]TDR35565.1 uncharacterized protein DUF4124 [Tahibacter aquaticus]